MNDGEFHLLFQYESPESWVELSRKEREHFGKLFISRARAELGSSQGDPIKSLECAEGVAGDIVPVLLAIADYWNDAANHYSREVDSCMTSLAKAQQYYHAALQKRSKDVRIVSCCAQISVQRGVLDPQGPHFDEAEELFQRVNVDRWRSKKQRGLFYWRWASKWLLAAEASGEPLDYGFAMEKCALAAHCGIQQADFFFDWGSACFRFAEETREERYFEDAARHFYAAVQKEEQHHEAWLGLARTFELMFLRCQDEAIFEQANMAYRAAVLIRKSHEWMDYTNIARMWVCHSLRGGILLEDPKLLREGIKHCDMLYPEGGIEGEELRLYIDALLVLAEEEESLDFLKQAERLTRDGLKGAGQDSFLRVLLGDLLCTKADYFEDPQWCRQAMEQYARALAIDSENFRAHMGMAYAGLTLGQATEEVAFLEKAVRHLQRVIALCPDQSDAWGVLGRTYLIWGGISVEREKYIAAIAAYERVFEFEGGVHVSENFNHLLNYGQALDNEGLFGEEEQSHRRAVEVLSRAAALCPDDAVAHYRLALAWLHCGELSLDLDDYRKSIDQLQRACELEPEEGRFWDKWGSALLLLAGLVQDPMMAESAQELRIQAEDRFRRAVSLGILESLYHLACCAAQVGDIGVALDYLHKAKQRGGLPPVEQLLNDEWMAPLREQPDFSAFVNSL